MDREQFAGDEFLRRVRIDAVGNPDKLRAIVAQAHYTRAVCIQLERIADALERLVN